MTNMILSNLIVLSLFILLTFGTSKDIIHEVDKKNREIDYFKNNYYKLLIGLPIYIFLIYIIAVNKTNFNNTQITIWTSLNTIYYHCFAVATITDKEVKRINRHTLRFAYIINFICLIILCKQIYPDYYTSVLWSLGATALILLVLFFLSNMGSSDFRCLFVTVPTYIVFYRELSILVIAISFIAIIAMFIIKRRKEGKKQEIPIGNTILTTHLILSLLVFLLIY